MVIHAGFLFLRMEQRVNRVEFGEDQLENLNGIAAKLFEDATDPRSYAYKRILLRPKIHWGRIVRNMVLYLLIVLGVHAGLLYLGKSWELSILGTTGIALAILLFCAKKIMICMIQIYQRYAPASVRNKCRFEPSCSQYMLLSIQKYGCWRGLRKGISRLKQCNPDGGGYDMP